MTKRVRHEELIGLHCGGCGEPLARAYVAKSYPVAGGQFRRRVCPNCHEDVTSFEVVMGAQVELFVVNGVTRHNLGVLRQLVKAFGGKAASR